MPSIHFNYGNWQFWEPYNPPLYFGTQKVKFDGPNKLIIVHDDVTELDFRTDVYSAWKEWLSIVEQDNKEYLFAITAVGGDPLPGEGRFLGSTFFLENGWRMRTWEGDHELTVTGNLFTREGDPAFVDTLNPWTITINLNTSVFVETVQPTVALSNTDIQQIVSEVWSEDLGGTSASDWLSNIPENVWDEIVDAAKSQNARDKLKAIATKTQDIALS